MKNKIVLIFITITFAEAVCAFVVRPQSRARDYATATGRNVPARTDEYGNRVLPTDGALVAPEAAPPVTDAQTQGQGGSTQTGNGQANTPGADDEQQGERLASARAGAGEKCEIEIDNHKRNLARYRQLQNASPAPATPPTPPTRSEDLEKCLLLGKMGGLEDYEKEITESQDKKIQCKAFGSYTLDYGGCKSAAKTYDFVLVAEKGLELTQQVRTDQKNQNLQKKVVTESQNGAGQTVAYDAAIESNQHQKAMQQEKAITYSAAVAALIAAYTRIPGENIAQKKCMEGAQAGGGNQQPQPQPQQALTGAEIKPVETFCGKAIGKFKSKLIANQSAKGALAAAIMEFTAKGIAAGIKMGQFDNAAQNVAKAKTAIGEEETDMMVERCNFNPTDPACSPAGTRTPGQSFSQGDFSFGGEGENNAFGGDPTTDTATDVADTAIDDKNSVAGVNSPFADDIKDAKGILNPAAAAVAKAGGAGAQGGGGGGGGLGGGSASLGSDLAGADKEGDKEAQIKAGKVSGTYGAAGGGGFKGIGKGKDDNPFSSLFDQKGGGGMEEDRSIASGDIDGSASGLFQKISKRYGQVSADKRIEAKNLE